MTKLYARTPVDDAIDRARLLHAQGVPFEDILRQVWPTVNREALLCAFHADKINARADRDGRQQQHDLRPTARGQGQPPRVD